MLDIARDTVTPVRATGELDQAALFDLTGVGHEAYTWDGVAVSRSVTTRSGEMRFTTQRIGERLALSGQDAFDLAWLRARSWPEVDSTDGVVKVVDLFSGCGGLTLGAWEAARALRRRLEPVLAVDVDPDALAVYGSNFPTATLASDPVEQLVDGDLGEPPTEAEQRLIEEIGPIDLLLAGPPCQGHS